MKYALIALLLLSGCSTTVPVVAKFPKVPPELTEKCQELQTITDDAKLSDVTKTVVINYTQYNLCSVKVDAWNEWYKTQQKLFESIK
jgi:hypothetical protein